MFNINIDLGIEIVFQLSLEKTIITFFSPHTFEFEYFEFVTLFTNTVTQSVLIERNKNFDCICNEESDCQQRGKSIYRICVPRLIIFVRNNCMIFILLSYICTQFTNPIDLNLKNIPTKNCNSLN